jgi:SAM-dependent methyltransferase
MLAMSRLRRWFSRLRGDGVIRHAESRIMRILERQNAQLSLIMKHLDVPETVDPSVWDSVAQPGELAFHKRPNIRSTGQWEAKNAQFWQRRGFSAEGWDGKLIVDVGAGSRLRSLFFRGARIIAIEPLAEKYIAEVEWQDLDRAEQVYAVPAEKDIPELHGRADLLVSMNALDHGYDFEAAVMNISRYLKPDGLAHLSFDRHDRPDNLHQLLLDDRTARAVFDRCDLAVERFEQWGRYHAGPGPKALHYWLRRRR